MMLQQTKINHDFNEWIQHSRNHTYNSAPFLNYNSWLAYQSFYKCAHFKLWKKKRIIFMWMKIEFNGLKF